MYVHISMISKNDNKFKHQIYKPKIYKTKKKL